MQTVCELCAWRGRRLQGSDPRKRRGPSFLESNLPANVDRRTEKSHGLRGPDSIHLWETWNNWGRGDERLVHRHKPCGKGLVLTQSPLIARLCVGASMSEWGCENTGKCTAESRSLWPCLRDCGLVEDQETKDRAKKSALGISGPVHWGQGREEAGREKRGRGPQDADLERELRNWPKGLNQRRSNIKMSGNLGCDALLAPNCSLGLCCTSLEVCCGWGGGWVERKRGGVSLWLTRVRGEGLPASKMLLQPEGFSGIGTRSGSPEEFPISGGAHWLGKEGQSIQCRLHRKSPGATNDICLLFSSLVLFVGNEGSGTFY